ncbi:MAG: DNA-directed RNA polymerase subunit beta [Elusimicrobia bacterium]|nr:DNA-directed RNA polymerase subunit beta [Elusimicrobiota bacterium]
MKKINFSRIPGIIPLPELLEMQKKSFEDFLQRDVEPAKRKIQGLQAVFLDVFPVSTNDETLTLEFVSYSLGEPSNTAEEAIIKDGICAMSLKATFRLLQRQADGKVKQIAEQEVYICDLPAMTETATFIINGAERVIVSQLHRSPGVIFEEDEEKKSSSYGKKLFFARIIPYRGAWVEFEFDLNNALYVRIDKRKKIPATVLLRALGIEQDADILRLFYPIETVDLHSSKVEQLIGRVAAEEVVDTTSGEVLLEANRELSKDVLRLFQERKIKSCHLLVWDPGLNDVTIRNTLLKDTIRSRREAVNALYRVLRAQEFIAPDQAETYLDALLFKSIRKYDLSKVGRYKILRKLQGLLEALSKRKNGSWEIPSERRRTLTVEDIIATMQYVVHLNNGVTEVGEGKTFIKVEVDDIDHLGNRRVRAVGELLENQIRIGLAQMARIVRERMNVQDKTTMTPRAIMNTAPVVAVVRKFFGTSQLSQFMDQTNPLAELTHKRRLSALGPGGLHRKRAGFEVRDVHHTHYGRICPIETPEGPNIGLITSLACYARVNEYGLIESPYRRVVRGRVTAEVVYLTADHEDEFVVAQANAPVDPQGRFLSQRILCRYRGDFREFPPEEIHFMDISPIQVVSASTALIPFLEHDDANRALMGSNMQRQAVPLLVTEPPLVGTGIEERAARDSGAVVTARRGGKVVRVTADTIAIWSEEGSTGVDLYHLRSYTRSNQDTCLNQVPLVGIGETVRKGEILADGACTANGGLALGRNLLVAFMPWEGYNFEDAILLSERLVREDVFTSVHIREFQMEARDTKMGAEEITRDIPNVGAEALVNLDDQGIIRVGAEVNPGDILVGKVAPKGEQQVTPEERLLKVIFGKKAEDTMDASLRVPPGVSGKIMSVRVFVRHERLSSKDERKRLEQFEAHYEGLLEDLRRQRKEKMADLDRQHQKRELTKKEVEAEKERHRLLYQTLEQELRREMARAKENLKIGDEMPVTVNKTVKVYVATKRRVQVGDKLAGRHGNKGVVAKILPPEDMPFLPDGTPVDVVLSPLSVPSRMNVGQLLEAMLGWAARVLNVQMICPVFDGAKEEQVIDMIRQAKEKLRQAGILGKYLPTDDGRFTLYDGRTGEPFESPVTVGLMYMIKLAHLVEDKIHARSTGPYSLITRQPLGGKAQFGGQRFGEMEVWAIEGYGGAYTLQEFLTVKADDVAGRTKMYEAIIKGETLSQGGVPESFKVLVRELRALGLNVELTKQAAGTDGTGAAIPGKREGGGLKD